MTRRACLIPLFLALAAAAGCAGGGRSPDVAPTDAAAPAPADALRARAAVLRSEDRRVLDDAVRGAATHPDPEVRLAAARALGRIGDPAGVTALLALAGDDDDDVRAESLFALARLDHEAAWPPVRQALGDESPVVRARATRLAGRVGGAAAVEPLVERLVDEDTGVVTAACYALAEAEEASAAVDTLIALSHDPEPALAASSIWALARFGERRDAVDIATRDRVRATLRQIARSPQPVVRMIAARGLAIPSRSEDAEVLGVLTKDPEALVRIEAVRSLSFPGAPLEPFITPVLGDENAYVLAAAVSSLGRMRGEDVVDVLANIIVYDEREWLRVIAIRALGTADPTRAAMVANGLSKDDSALVRAETARLLVGSHDDDAMGVARLLAADDDEDVRLAALAALGGVPGPLDETLAAALASDDPRALGQAARAAGIRLELAAFTDLDVESAWRVLRTVLDRATALGDGAAAGDAVVAAAKAGATDETRSFLRAALDQSAWEPRRRAAAALAELFDERVDPGPATDDDLDRYVEVLRWAERPRAAVVTIERPGFLPGRFTVRLDTENAPLTAWRFARAADERRYVGLPIDRVVPNRRIVTDDLGGGGRRAEPTAREFLPGVVLAAGSGPDMVGEGFEILTTGQPHLSGGETAFGQVVQNLAGVVALALPRDRVVRVVVYEGDGTEPLPALEP